MVASQESPPEHQARSAPPVSLIRLGLWVGLTVAVGELAVLAIMEFVLDRYLYYVSPQITWMLPIADLVIFGAIGALLAGVRRVAPKAIPIQVAVWLIAFVGFTSLAYHFDWRVHDIALLLLAAGAATQATRLALGRPELRVTVMRWSTIGFLGLIASSAVIAESRGPIRERAAMAALGNARADAPNVLLIIWDTVRSHDLSAYGYDRETTPVLARLADRGALFDQAMSTASWTLPSHAGMFTGHLPYEISANYTTPLDDAEPTLAETLYDQGYVTGGFVANYGAAGWESGLARGFVTYDDFPRSLGQVFISARLIRTLLKLTSVRRVIGYYDVLGRRAAPSVTRRFLEWQTENADRPFFAFLNYYDAHAPYLPPDDYATRFGPERPHGDPLLIERMNEPSEWDPAALQAELDAYDGSIAYLDDELEVLLGELERRGVLDNTLVVLTSDHGEEFGEHDMLGHGDYLWAPLIRVPLVVAMPGQVPPGTTVHAPVSLRDLPRTVLDLIGAEGSENFPGRSLAPLWGTQPLETTAMASPTVDPVYSQEEGRVSIVVGRFHYIVDQEGTEHLFDLIEDPLEAHDLAADPAQTTVLEAFRRLGVEPR